MALAENLDQRLGGSRREKEGVILEVELLGHWEGPFKGIGFFFPFFYAPPISILISTLFHLPLGFVACVRCTLHAGQTNLGLLYLERCGTRVRETEELTFVICYLLPYSGPTSHVAQVSQVSRVVVLRFTRHADACMKYLVEFATDPQLGINLGGRGKRGGLEGGEWGSCSSHGRWTQALSPVGDRPQGLNEDRVGLRTSQFWKSGGIWDSGNRDFRVWCKEPRVETCICICKGILQHSAHGAPESTALRMDGQPDNLTL